MKKTILVLANSVKYGQHCVAGKDIITKNWIRPVSNINGGALTREQILCKNPYAYEKFQIKVIQEIEIEFLQKAPLINQPENFVITDKIWIQQYSYSLSRNELDSYLDYPDILWSNLSSSGRGENDRVNYEQILRKDIIIVQSLYFIKVYNATLIIAASFGDNEKKRVRLSFYHKNIHYNLAVTDPAVWGAFINRGTGQYPFNGEIYLCISLGQPFNDGFCYKLVATIL
ncbi:Uncharacterized protein dnl_60920 [Desulfonema limicola]|uniref:Dual OB-containing domain-containing protein n=1 Tax=Desulfonema limicola TaxID=45656 RepID=A0A975BE63_9BACT|nr:hypothetical protein [Desulfonema limicola]QTA83678.1 Uncharacterized protein dnl_60920 [Desulfonema limicola]